MSFLEKCVREFHEKYGCVIGDTSNPGMNKAQLRKNLIIEECEEFAEAVEWNKFPEAVHEAIDILYVAMGALVTFGIKDTDKFIAAVHEANMRKTGGSTREDGKIMKPEGWVKADINSLIEQQKSGAFEEDSMNGFDFDKPHLNTPIVPQEAIDRLTEALAQEKPKRGRPRRVVGSDQ